MQGATFTWCEHSQRRITSGSEDHDRTRSILSRLTLDITALSISWISNREFAHDHVLHVSIFLETGIHEEGIKHAPSEEQHRRENSEETRQEQAEKGLDDAAEENPS
jgi:hypothetical protein